MIASDIDWIRLIAGHGILIIPLSILIAYKTRLAIPVIIAAFRMTIQLLLVGIYLKYIFLWNNALLNLSWATMMILIATPTVIKRAETDMRKYFVAIFGAMFLGVFFTTGILLVGVINLSSPFDARYMIPIVGMITGNSMNSSVVGVRSFFSALKKEQSSYRYRLACGATYYEASNNIVRDAMKASYSPSIATMANVGLISLPGMMTGQILGGSDPMVAIKYQILIMLGIHTGSLVSVFLALKFSRRIALG